MGVFDNVCIQRIRHLVARAGAVIFDRMRPIDSDQKRVEIQIVQMRRPTRNLRQQISPPDHLIQRPCPDRGQDFSHLLRIEGDQVDDLVGIAGEFRAQILALRTDANRTGI